MMCYRDMTFCSGSDQYNYAFPNEEGTICTNKECHRHASRIPKNVRNLKEWPIAWSDFRDTCPGYTKEK